VCFVVCKTISELERAILTTLFFLVQKTLKGTSAKILWIVRPTQDPHVL
jgi:hypothetical protein